MKTELLGPNKKVLDELLKIQKAYKNNAGGNITPEEKKARCLEIERVATKYENLKAF